MAPSSTLDAWRPHALARLRKMVDKMTALMTGPSTRAWVRAKISVALHACGAWQAAAEARAGHPMRDAVWYADAS